MLSKMRKCLTRFEIFCVFFFTFNPILLKSKDSPMLWFLKQQWTNTYHLCCKSRRSIDGSTFSCSSFSSNTWFSVFSRAFSFFFVYVQIAAIVVCMWLLFRLARCPTTSICASHQLTHVLNFQKL